MDRRDFLCRAGLVSASFALSNRSDLFAQSAPPAGWRTFEITTRVEVLRPAGRTRVWLPTPLTIETPYQKPLGNTLAGDGGTTFTRLDPASANAIACFEFPEGVTPVAVLTCRAMTHDYSVDLAQPRPRGSTARPESKDEIARFLEPSFLVPTDGIVKDDGRQRSRRAPTPTSTRRARSTSGSSRTRSATRKCVGCGIGDIRCMLESKNFGGKCADINALYVGLARAAGLPARHVYGLRVAKSDRGFKSLGLATANATRASIAARRCIWPATAGCRSILRTSARSCSRSRREPDAADERVVNARGRCSAPGR